jgi:hypothetical protein
MKEIFKSLKIKNQGKYFGGGITEVINADHYITWSFVTYTVA